MFYLFKLFIKKRLGIYWKNSFQLTHKLKKQYVWKATTIISIFFYFFLFFKYDINLYIDVTYLIYKNNLIVFLNYIYLKFLLNFKLIFIFNNIYYFDVTNERTVIYDKITFFLQNLINFYEYYFDHGYMTVLNKFNSNFESITQVVRYLYIIIFIFMFICTFYIYTFNIFLSYTLLLFSLLTFVSTTVLYNNYNLFFKITYLNFLIDESFLNRNLYVDSNYFLTNDAMRGIEKFSDITSPWLVDFEDFGWGGEFGVQPIQKQIIERERRFILENMYIDNSPNMENTNTDPGSIKTRFLKLIRRFEIFSFYLNSFMEDRHRIKNTWKRHYFYKNLEFWNLKNSMSKPLRLQNTSNFLLNRDFYSSSAITPKLTFKLALKDDIKKFGYTFRMGNSFFLSKKNNITNDVNLSGSNVKDRSNIVFRNVINSLDTLESTQGVISRRPDTNTDSNYIFERQLQEGRVLDYELKKYLLRYLKYRYKYYFQNKIFFNTNLEYVIGTKFTNALKINKNNLFNSVNLGSEKNLEYGYSLDYKKHYISKYLKLDERVENLTKILNSELNLHLNFELEDSEFPYLKNYTREVSGFLDKFGFIDDVLSDLLDEKKLKLGLYTYSSLKKKPWEYTNTTISDYWGLHYKSSKYSLDKTTISYFDKFKNIKTYINFIGNKFATLDKLEKKLIYLKTTNHLKPSWFYFNKVLGGAKMDKFFYLAGSSDYILKKDNNAKNDIFIENFWKNTNSLFLSLYYSNSNYNSSLSKIQNSNKQRLRLVKFFFIKNTYLILPKTSILNLNFIYLYIRRYTPLCQPFLLVKYPNNLESKFEFFIKYYKTFVYKKHEYFLVNFYIISPLNFNWITKVNKIKKLQKNIENFIYFIKKHFRTDLGYFLVTYPKYNQIYYYFGNLKIFLIKFFTKKNSDSGSFMLNLKPFVLKKIKKLPTTVSIQKSYTLFIVNDMLQYCKLHLYFFFKTYIVKNSIFLNFYFNFFKSDFNFLYIFISFYFFLCGNFIYLDLIPDTLPLKLFVVYFYYLICKISKDFGFFIESNTIIEDLMRLHLNSVMGNTTVNFIFLNYSGSEYFYEKIKLGLLNCLNSCSQFLSIVKIQQYRAVSLVYYYCSNFLNSAYLNIFSFLFILNFKFLFFIFYTIFNNLNSLDFFDRVFDVEISNFNLYRIVDRLIDSEFLKFICFTNKIDFKLLYELFFFGKYLDTNYKIFKKWFLYYLELKDREGIVYIADRVTLLYLKYINVWYSKTFTRIIPYHTDYYTSLTTDILDKCVFLFSKNLKNFIFFLLNFTKDYIKFISKLDNFIYFRVLENFKTYFSFKLFYKALIYNYFLFYLDIFIFKREIESLAILGYNTYSFFFYITTTFFDKLNMLGNIFIKPIIDFLGDYIIVFFTLFDLSFSIAVEILFLFNINTMHTLFNVIFDNLFFLFFFYFFKNYTNFAFYLKYSYLDCVLFLNSKLPNFLLFSENFNIFNFNCYLIKICINLFLGLVKEFLYFLNYTWLVGSLTGCTIFNNYTFFLYSSFCIHIFKIVNNTTLWFLQSINLVFLFYKFILYVCDCLSLLYFMYIFIFIKQIYYFYFNFYISTLRDFYVKVIFYSSYLEVQYVIYKRYYKILKFKLFIFLIWVEDVYLYNFNIKLRWLIIDFNLNYWYNRFYIESLYYEIRAELLNDDLFLFSIYVLLLELIYDNIYLKISKLEIFLNSIYLYFFYLQKIKILYFYFDVCYNKIVTNKPTCRLKYKYTLFFKYSITNNRWTRLFSYRSGQVRWKKYLKFDWNSNTFRRVQIRTFIFWFSHLKFKPISPNFNNNFSIFLFYKKWTHLLNIKNIYFLINNYTIPVGLIKVNLNLDRILIFMNKINPYYKDEVSALIKFKTQKFKVDNLVYYVYKKKNNIIFLNSYWNLNSLLYLEIFFSKTIKNLNIENVFVYEKNKNIFSILSKISESKYTKPLEIPNNSIKKENNFFKFNTENSINFILSYINIKLWYKKVILGNIFKNLNVNWQDFTLWRHYIDNISIFGKIKINNMFNFNGFLFFESFVDKIKVKENFLFKFSSDFGNFTMGGVNLGLLLNFLNFDNYTNTGLLSESKKHNRHFFDKNSSNLLLNKNDIFFKNDTKFKNTSENYFNLRKKKYKKYEKNNVMYALDLLSIRFFFNFFNKINDVANYSFYKQKAVRGSKYFITYVDNLKINNLFESSYIKSLNYAAFGIFIKISFLLKVFFDFFSIHSLDFFIDLITYYTHFDKKLTIFRLKNIFNSEVNVYCYKTFKFGYMYNSDLYRYIINKIVFAKPIILDKLPVYVSELQTRFNAAFEQKTIINLFFKYIKQAHNYIIYNFFNYIFWFSHINAHLYFYSLVTEFECLIISKVTKLIYFYIKFLYETKKVFYILFNLEILHYYYIFLSHTDKVLSSFKNFVDTYFYSELFIEDILKFQLMTQYKLFHAITHVRDVHKLENKTINKVFYDMRVNEFSFIGKYFYKYIFFYIKFNDVILGKNVYTLYRFFFYFRVYFDLLLQYLQIALLSIFSEIKSDYQEFNTSMYLKYFNLFEEIADIFDENVFCWVEHYIQNYFQIFWLEITIIFDHIFEYLTEVDYELEDSPFNLFLEEFKTVSTSFLRGIPLYEVDYSSFDFNEWSEFNSSYTENDNFHGFSDIDVEDGLGFLGWGFNDDFGANPGSEFSTINDISEIPEFLEKILLFDVNDFYNNIFGLDDPQLGNLQPSFDVSLPIKSLWVVGAVYYDPFWGGAALIDIDGLMSFLKILYIDRRTFWFNNLFILNNYFIYNDILPGIIFFKFKLIYFFYDILQILDLVYLSVFDILHFWIFYLLYMFEILGIFTIIATFIFFLVFLKLNNIFEKKERIFSKNKFSINFLFYNFWNYTIYRYFYIVLSNSILFFKMSVSILVILTISYVFSEGLHILSILRVLDVSQESTLYLNAQYFILERDPFVEKHNPTDEMLDTFRYESSIDDEWSRIHFSRETAEMFGGPGKEQGTIIDSLGFAKKFNISFDIEDDAEEMDTTLAIDAKYIVDQIHNNFSNEYSFMPNFFQDSVLEREFFRESELYGEEVEGSLDFLNRSENRITDIWFDFNFEDMHDEQNLQGSLEFEEEEDLWDSELYAAMLLNMADPKWLYNYSQSLTALELTPQIIGSNQSQLYSNSIDSKFHFYDKLSNYVISENRILNLLRRNRGNILYSPILDFYDEDASVDWGLDINNEYGTSMGTLSNLIDIWDDHTADPITQLTKHSNNPSINDPILLNYTSTDDVLPPNYYAGEDLIFENFFDSLYNIKVPGFEKYLPSSITDDPFDEEEFTEESEADSYDNFFPRIGRFAMIEDNYKNKNFVSDFMPESYFNLTSYVFKDLQPKTKNVVNTNNFSTISLENIRKRDLTYKKLEGISPINIFYDDMISDDLDKLIYFNLENTNANWGNTSFYKNNEFSQKMDLSQKNIWWTPAGNEHGTIYFDESDHGHKDPYTEHLNENDFDLVDFLRSENQEDWFVSDIFHDKISQLKSVMKKRKWKPQRDLLSDNLKIYNTILPDWYMYKYTIDSNGSNRNTTKTANNKFSMLPLLFENNKLLSYFIQQSNSKLNYLKTKINTNGEVYPDTKNFNHILKYASKDTKILFNLYTKKKIRNISDGQIPLANFEYFDDINDTRIFIDNGTSLLIENSSSYLTNSDFLNINKIKPSLMHLLKINLSKLTDNVKTGIKTKYINNSNIIIGDDYASETFNAKLEQYLNSFEADFDNFTLNNTGKKEYLDVKNFIFFNKKWVIDNIGKIHYSLFSDNDIYSLNSNLTEIKNNKNSIKTNVQTVNKNITQSSKIREFAATPDRGYWSDLKDEMSQDERLTGILNPKIIENPIFLNDSEAFREFSEMWNYDFGRKDNNLEILSMGQPRELALYDHYSNTSDFNPIKHEIPIDGNWAEYDDDLSEFFGVDDSSFEVEDKLRAGESWYGFNFDIGKNWHKYHLSNFSKLIENRLLSKKYINKINWFNFEKFGINQNTKNYKNPWGLNITTKYNFSGSQNWNFQKNDENFLKLLTNGGFRIFNNENTEAIEFTKNKINVTNTVMGNRYITANSNTDKDSKNMSMVSRYSRLAPMLHLYGGGYKKNNLFELKNDNFTGLDLDLTFNQKIKFLKNLKDADSSYYKNKLYNFEILQNNINTKTYQLEYDPDEFGTNIDMNWDADLKFDYTTRFYQYGRMFKSIDQNNVILEHFKSNIALDNIAITPDQSSDYFWYTYKKHKNNKFDNFFKKVNYSKQVPTQNKILKLNFENFIKSPITDNLKNNTTLEDFNNLTTDIVFPSLSDSWDSGYLDLKLNYSNFDKTIPVRDYELLDIDDFDYQDLNKNNNWDTRNKKIKNKLKKNTSKNLPNRLFVKKEKNDIDTLYSITEDISSSSVNPEIWWSNRLNRKFKNIKQSKENYLFDNLFGFYRKRWNGKHAALREKNSQMRHDQIAKHLFKNIKLLKNYKSNSKVWLKFSNNKNLLNALGNVFKLKNTAILDTKHIQDPQLYNNSQDFDFLENENNLNIPEYETLLNSNFENLPHITDSAVPISTRLGYFNAANSVYELNNDLDDSIFADNLRLKDTSTVLEYENRQQFLSLYLKNNKYSNILNSIKFVGGKNRLFNFETNLNNLDDLSETNSLTTKFNHNNVDLYNYSRWNFNQNTTKYNSGDYSKIKLINNPNAASTVKNIKYFNSNSTDSLQLNNYSFVDSEGFLSDIDDIRVFENDFDDWSEYGMDLHYFNSKKINTLQSIGVDYKSNGVIRPVTFENSAITLSEVVENNKKYEMASFSEFNEELLEPEDSNIFHITKYYDNVLEKNNLGFKKIKKDHYLEFVFKKNIYNSLSTAHNNTAPSNYLSTPKKIVSSQNTETSIKNSMTDIGDGLGNSVSNLSLIEKTNLDLDNFVQPSFVKGKKSSNSLDFAVYSDFMEKNKDFFIPNNFSNLSNSTVLWKNKNKNYENDYYFENDLTSDSYKNTIKKLTKTNVALKNSLSYLPYSIYLDKFSKTDLTFGNSRFFNKEGAVFGFNKSKYKFLGNSVNRKNIKLKQLTKIDNFGYIKNENSIKNYEKDISGFYSNYFNDSLDSDLNYIESVSQPLVKNIKLEEKKNNQSNQYFIFNNKLNNNSLVFENTKLKTYDSFGNFLKWNNSRKLSSIFKTNYQNINAKAEKTNNFFRNFSYSESIYPLPIVKSLSVNSNLFNKINSLRLFGAGRLSDYFYNTKLKHILSSDKQSIDYDDDDDVEYSEDQFLLEFDEDDDIDYWHDDFESGADIIDDTTEDSFVDKNHTIRTKKDFNTEDYVLENIEDMNDVIENFNKTVDEYDFINEYVNFNSILEDSDVYDVLDEREFELETEQSVTNKNLIENLPGYSIKNVFSNSNQPDYLVNANFENIGSTVTGAYTNFQKVQDYYSEDYQYFENDFDTIDQINLTKVPIGEDIEHINFTDNLDGDFENLLLTTMENLVDFSKNSKYFENLEQVDVGLLNSLEESLDGLENIQDITNQKDLYSSQSIKNFSKNVNSNFVKDSNFLPNSNVNFESQFNIADCFDTESVILANTTLDDLDDDFNYNLDDFEDITNFMSTRFLYYEVPSEKLNTSLHGLNFNSRNSVDSFSNIALFDRKSNHLSYNKNNFYKKNVKKINNLFTNYSTDNLARRFFNYANLLEFGQESLETNWFLNRSYWSDIVEEYEYFGDKNLDYEENGEENLYESLAQLDNSQNLENTEILENISEYFIDNKLLISEDTELSDSFLKNTLLTSHDNDYSLGEEDTISKNSAFSSSWNASNGVYKGNWGLKKNNKVSFKNYYQKNSNLQIKEELADNNSNYVFKNATLGLDTKNKKSILNINTLLRKASSNASNNQYSVIKKFINLKKKYLTRLDTAEKYIYNLKNITVFNTIKDNIGGSFLLKNKNELNKPIHVNILNFIKSVYGNRSIDIGLENFSYYLDDDRFIKKNIDSFDFMLENGENTANRLINFKNNLVFKNFKKLKNNNFFSSENTWSSTFKNKTKDLKLLSMLSEKTQKYNSFYKNFEQDIDDDVELQSAINEDSFFGGNSEYLAFKLDSLKKKLDFNKNYDENFENSVEVLEDGTWFYDENIDDSDFNEDSEDIFDIYSKVRNDLQKLESNKYSNNFLPPSIVSNFLNTIPKINIAKYLNEVPKTSNYYKNIKTSIGYENYPNSAFDFFLDKESKKSIKRLNNISYFKKLPVFDQFGIYHKKLSRPGLDLNNQYSTVPLDPFRSFSTNKELYDRSIKYGSGEYIFKNNPVSRRSFDLTARTFGPDIITNSTLLGYGRLDYVSDLNQDDEEDSGIYDNIGYPVVNEQNLYNYDYPDIVDTYITDNIFSIDFLDFMWDIEGEDDLDYRETSRGESAYLDGYAPFFDLTENYERLPLFSIFLPSNINLNPNFILSKMRTWPDFFDYNDTIFPKTTFFNLNVMDIDDEVDSSGFFSNSISDDFSSFGDDADDDIDDDYEEDFEDSNGSSDIDLDNLGGDEGGLLDADDSVNNFYKDLGSLTVFDFSPIGFLSTVKWLDYFEGETIDNASFDDEDEDDEDEGFGMSPLNFLYSVFVDPDENDTVDENNLPKGFLEPAFNSRYFQTWNASQNLSYEPRPEMSDLDDDEADDDLLDIYAETINFDLTEEESNLDKPLVYRFPNVKQTKYDIVSKLKMETELEWDMPGKMYSNGYDIWNNPVDKPETELVGKVYIDAWDQNIGPLGYEEGDTIYENRILNRGWFPEKIIWNWGIRDQSRIGNDLTTLELLSDYTTSFSHNEENFGTDPDDEALLSLSWAGKNNKLFNFVDDIVEGVGIEEDLPFSPETARKLWEYEEHEARKTYEKDVLGDPWYFNEDDEEDFYTNYNDPETFYHYKDDLFNTLGFIRFEAESNAWQNTNYLGNLDSTMLSGSSMALSNNIFYDGIMTDFSNFIYEKFPVNPKNNIITAMLPNTTEGMFITGDFHDSQIPGFAEFLIDGDGEEEDDEDAEDEEDAIEKDETFNLMETFKPKDTFNFSPNDTSFLVFEPEWVINGEGWLGNTGSGLKIFNKDNMSNKYLNPESEYVSMPKGIHSFEVLNDEDMFLGLDSPYFSLTDFQKNRIIRGRDNDVSNFPIKSGWNLPTGFTPEAHNLFWKHRMRSGDHEYSVWFESEEFSYQFTNSDASAKTGIGIPFSDTLMDNPDYLVFSDIEVNQRNLWWKSISGGHLSENSKISTSIGVVLNNSESYRDFLLSYDYRIFGKSWINPQSAEAPLKSFNFYKDSQINDWLTASDSYSDSNSSLDIQNNYSIFDYTYGHFLNSQTNFETNTTYYSVTLRNFLYKAYHIFTVYFNYVYDSISNIIKMVSYFFLSSMIYKVELLYVFLGFFKNNIYNFTPFNFFFYQFLKFTLFIYSNFINFILFFENTLLTLVNISVFDLYYVYSELTFCINWFYSLIKNFIFYIKININITLLWNVLYLLFFIFLLFF